MSNRSLTVTLRLDNSQYIHGLRQAAAETDALAKRGDRAGVSLKGMLATAATGAAAVGIAKLVKDSVSLEAAYSKTMRQVAVQTKAPKQELQELDDLAMKLGADTVFSAQDAGNAMLALAKGGLTSAQIQAGALQNSLTLAAAGNLDLGVAADSVVNTMGAFGLKAEQTGAAVAALAGAANASSAEVSDITQALAQAGTEANAAGLSVQETTGILAAFSNAGIRGSDAGTSLRTMLTRLVPQTKAQAAEMDRLGLSFTNANGEFVSGEEIAGRLQKAYKGMSAEERTASLNTVFGADARRAANVLIGEGTEGIRDYVKQTSDLGAAEKLAQAGMQGTSGALEQLDGALETAKIQIGRGLAPVIQDVAGDLANLLENGDVEGWAKDAGQGVSDFIDEMKPLASSILDLSGSALPGLIDAGGTLIDVLEVATDVLKPLVDLFGALPAPLQQTLVGALALSRGATAISGTTDKLAGLRDTLGETDKKAALMRGGLLAAGLGMTSLSGQIGEVDKTAGAITDTLGTAAIGFSVAGPWGAAIGGAVGLISSLKDANAQAADEVERLADTYDRASGKMTQATRRAAVDELSKPLEKGIFGFGKIDMSALEAAKKIGINLTTMTDAALGSDRALSQVKGRLREINNLSTDQFRAEAKRLGISTNDLADIESYLGDVVDKNSDKWEKAGQAARLAAEAESGQITSTKEFAKALQGVPKGVVTELELKGYEATTAEVNAIARKYKLTPAQVQTVLAALDRVSPTVRRVHRELDRLNGKVATTTIRTIEETFRKPTKSDPAPSLRDMTQNGGKPSRATGGTVPPGYALGGQYGGGIVPGTAPADPRVDNVLAYGATSKQPILVRSGEWIINQKQSDANDEWLAAINAGLNLNDILGPPMSLRYADGGRYDAGTALEITQMRVRVRDLKRSLRERETYKTKSGQKRSRPTLRGLDRVQAKQELDEAEDELRGTLSVTRAGRRRGMGPERYNAYREAKRDQAEELKQTRADAKQSFLDNATIGTLRTPEAVERSLMRTLQNMGTFTSLLITLKKQGASPWLLNQLQEAGPTPGAITLARRYTQDKAALARMNGLVGDLTQVSAAYAKTTTDPKWSVSKAWNPALSQNSKDALARSIDVKVSAIDETTVAREVARHVEHKLTSMALAAGI